jgi:hypothetical protein
MAISQGVRQHAAWIEISGGRFPVQQGSVEASSSSESSTFSCTIPLNAAMAEQAFANVAGVDAKVIVSTGMGEKTLITGPLDGATFDYIGGTITAHGRDKSADLHQTKVNESWLNKKPTEIIEDVAKKAGIDVNVEVTGMLKAGRVWDKDWVKLADSVSASSVVDKMCEFLGARWWFDSDGKMHVTDQPGDSYMVSYQPGPPIVSDAIHLSVSKNYQAAKEIKVSVKSWHQKKKQVIESEKTVKTMHSASDWIDWMKTHDYPAKAP